MKRRTKINNPTHPSRLVWKSHIREKENTKRKGACCCAVFWCLLEQRKIEGHTRWQFCLADHDPLLILHIEAWGRLLWNKNVIHVKTPRASPPPSATSPMQILNINNRKVCMWGYARMENQSGCFFFFNGKDTSRAEREEKATMWI